MLFSNGIEIQLLVNKLFIASATNNTSVTSFHNMRAVLQSGQTVGKDEDSEIFAVPA
jgi:hypothetical protein